MAERLEDGQMLFNDFEPKRVFRWLFEIDGIDAFTAKTAARPKKNYGETQLEYINERRWIAGKGEWQPLPISLYDPIEPSQAVKVMEWLKLVHNDANGRMGYASAYKKNFTLKLLDPEGTVIEQWTCKGAWPKEINFGDLDYGNEDALMVEFTIRADKWFLDF